MAAGAPPQTPLGELTVLFQLLLDDLGGEEKGREKRGWERREEGGEGRGKMCLYEILNTPLLTEPLPKPLPRLMSGFTLGLKLPQVLRPIRPLTDPIK